MGLISDVTLTCHRDRRRIQSSLPGRSSVTAGDDGPAGWRQSLCCLCTFTSAANHPQRRPQMARHRLTKTQTQSREKTQRMLGKPELDFTESGEEDALQKSTRCPLVIY